jgi:peptidoglycan L-alanyl-D-glutamate endopeptidase CwlK
VDKISEARLALVHPVLAAKVRQMADLLKDEFEFRVCQALRSWADQAALYGKGRTAPGEPCSHDRVRRPVGTCPEHPQGLIVTKCRPGYSWHGFGLAVDLGPDDPTKPGFQVDWDGEHPQWKRMELVGESVGLYCGADFRSFPDQPHFEMTGKFPASLVGAAGDEVRQLFRDGGMEAVWAAAFPDAAQPPKETT